MSMGEVIIMTGVTSGLGLAAAKHLLARRGTVIIAGARRTGAGVLSSLVETGRFHVEPLDLTSLSSVRDFVSAVRQRLGDRAVASVACNAGLQVARGPVLTAAGCEITFAANHLGHFLLAHELMQHLAPGAAVISTASGTHNPHDPLARRFGYRGGIFPDAQRVAAGDLDSGAAMAQRARDWYATSKLCNILFVRRWSADTRQRRRASSPSIRV